MTPLEIKVEILKALLQRDFEIKEELSSQVIANRQLNVTKIDDALQVEPIIMAKIVNIFYKELNK